MKHQYKFPLLILSFYLLFINLSYELSAQHNKKITPDDYGKWETLKHHEVAKNGHWLTYRVDNVNKDRTVHLYNIRNKSTRIYQNADNAYFSETGSWFIYEVVLSGEEQKKKTNKKAKENDISDDMNDKVLVNLSSFDTLILSNISKYSFSKRDTYLAMLAQSESSKTLIVKNLESGTQFSFGNVKAFEWSAKREILAMILESKDSTINALQIFSPKENLLKVLDHSKEIYSNLRFGEKSDYLFATKTLKQKNSEEHSYQLLHWHGFSNLNPLFSSFNPALDTSFQDNKRILPSNITISDDGNSVFFEAFSLKAQDQSKQKGIDVNEDLPEVEIWHSKDQEIISQQKKSPLKSSEKPSLHVWHINENKHITLSDSLVNDIRLQENNERFIGLNQSPYMFDAMFGRPSYDIYLINSKNGKVVKALTDIKWVSSVSPNSQFFVYVKDNDLHLYNITNHTSSNITRDLDDAFFRGDSFDYPVDQKPPFSGVISAWNKDGSSFLFNSEYDVWQGYTDGRVSKRLTNGRSEEIIFRHMFLHHKDKFFELDKEQYFSMKGKKSKKTGIAKGIIGKELKVLAFENLSLYEFNQPHKQLDILSYKTQSFDKSPNLNISSLNFKKSRQVSTTNVFQKDYRWGKAELINFKNAKNKLAQGILYYPADYKKGEKYPMITYIYERLSDRYHRYTIPSKNNYYNTTIWQQEGYFVLKPDIEFTPGNPGVSSTKTLENAVAKVIEMGDVDPDKVGLVGHSWGGYQAGFVPTQTDIFAASVAGAGITDLVSMYLAVTPAFDGEPENYHFEVSQERMITPPWITPENYRSNSSVMNVKTLNTPILFEVADKDMNVNWSQGVEYYNAARREGKQFIMLVYKDEGHRIRKEKNAFDYQQKILKWFGHYLKGREAADWISNGIPYRDQINSVK
ncbi:prolyl oligopeptidase family serine peptidase [Robiginitalea sp. IMCC44478]|uniref:prolyl oligopeptidase family serine peptidase n=1 Tax=Robiginitalea sp. IMCC44478 TaxID=3459122 RepID=UPI004041278C